MNEKLDLQVNYSQSLPLLTSRYPLFIQKFALLNPSKSGQIHGHFQRPDPVRENRETVDELLWWRDYFTQKKNLITVVGRWGSPGFTPKKIERIEIHLESLAGQRNEGGKRNKNRGAHVRGTG